MLSAVFDDDSMLRVVSPMSDCFVDHVEGSKRLNFRISLNSTMLLREKDISA